ncbi:MAG: phosphoglycerate dehydrogenase [Candidatus Limnocylindria bacterium]
MVENRTVLVTTRSFGAGDEDPEALLRAAGLSVVRGDPGHELVMLLPHLARAEGWIAGTAPIGAVHLEAAPMLRIVARYGVGVDSIDLDAARRRGVAVTNTPGANTEAVADLTIGVALAALRGIVEGDRAVRAGDWSGMVGRELGECTVGIVGYGQIGRAVHRRLSGFGSRVVAHDPFAAAVDIPLVSLAELVRMSDIVTLHAPATSRPLIDGTLLTAMRPGAILLNMARAVLVDEAAAAELLRTGRLGALATDVLSTEDRGRSPLLDAPNVILTPHIGGQSVQAVDRMGMGAARECVRVLVHGEAPEHPVLLGASS